MKEFFSFTLYTYIKALTTEFNNFNHIQMI